MTLSRMVWEGPAAPMTVVIHPGTQSVTFVVEAYKATTPSQATENITVDPTPKCY